MHRMSHVHGGEPPPELSASLKAFKADSPDAPTAFVMMKFGTSPAHQDIRNCLRWELAHHDIKAVRADDRQYHPSLYYNVMTYMHGATFGIAVFERLEGDDFNPNVSLELGYMLGLGKPVCLLKDRTLKNLHTDIVGQMYCEFDPQNIKETLGKSIHRWISDHAVDIGVRPRGVVHINVSAFDPLRSKVTLDLGTLRALDIGTFTSAIRDTILRDTVRPYHYGTDWVLRDPSTGVILKTRRLLERQPVGEPCFDRRPLRDWHIEAETVLEAIRPPLPTW